MNRKALEAPTRQYSILGSGPHTNSTLALSAFVFGCSLISVVSLLFRFYLFFLLLPSVRRLKGGQGNSDCNNPKSRHYLKLTDSLCVCLFLLNACRYVCYSWDVRSLLLRLYLRLHLYVSDITHKQKRWRSRTKCG